MSFIETLRMTDGYHEFHAHLELREARASGSIGVASGHAAVFDSPSQDLGGFTEFVKPGAFTRCLRGKPDVRALVDHDPSKVLGRSTAGTLRLSEDRIGLLTEIDLPNTTVGRDLKESISRGDVTSMSFAFKVKKDAWRRMPDKSVQRDLLDCELLDVSAVCYPAYPAATVGVRSSAGAADWMRDLIHRQLLLELEV